MSNIPAGIKHIPWYRRGGCSYCGAAWDYEWDEDDEGHKIEVPVIPIETEAGNFCSDRCRLDHREKAFNAAGYGPLLIPTRMALNDLDNLPLAAVLEVTMKYATVDEEGMIERAKVTIKGIEELGILLDKER